MSKKIEYSPETWASVRREWLAGQLSVSDIGRSYGPSRQAITAKAKREVWGKRGSLVDEVRKEIASQLLEDEDAPVAEGVAPAEASAIVESAAKRGVTVVRRQRKLIARLLNVASATLSDMERTTQVSEQVLMSKNLKERVALLESATKANLDGMRVISQVLSQAIPLERKAYSLDDDKDSAAQIIYQAPDYDKPRLSGLSEEDWKPVAINYRQGSGK